MILLVRRDAPTGVPDCVDGGSGPDATACYLAEDVTEPGPLLVVGDTGQVSDAVADRLAEFRR